MRIEAKDNRLHTLSFNSETYLRCPRCEGLAISRVIEKGSADWFAPRRLVCTSCGYVKVWASRGIARSRGQDATDDYFKLPLYLQAPCRSGVVWAYNPEHLAYLKSWVAAPLRSRRKDAEYGWSNSSYLSRLPAWLKSSKNRGELVSVLSHLEKLAALPPNNSLQGRRP